MLNNSGLIYNQLLQKIEYNNEMESCIQSTVENLIKVNTSSDKPGMLLGKIQSGKTRAFIGTIGLAFDNGYDISIVLTKGTRALAEQTFQRLSSEFKEMIERDKVQVFDIMHLADNLKPYILNQKLIFVVKKEVHNLERLHSALFKKYKSLSEKNILIVDDEADYGSVGFTKTKQEGIEVNKIAGLIDNLRNDVKKCSFLQVTATPYSLYLQPEDMNLGGVDSYFKPVKPAFTVLVPVGKNYIGGDYYFYESEENDSIASYIHENVEEKELLLLKLKKEDKRRFKLEESLISNKIKSLRDAIINFIVGGCIRRMQDENKNDYPLKYSFIIHTEQAKVCHEWQEELVNTIVDMLLIEAKNNSELFNKLIDESYGSLIQSLNLIQDTSISECNNVKYEVSKSLIEGYIMITKVNSEKDINELLDAKGQLKLITPLNIFIGGQILDRGITIGNLIGFYYGRNPLSFQQDTVLQHSRMFGYRPIEDLAVTRFYTTFRIYKVMKKIQEFDNGLRERFEKGSQNNGVVFIQKDNNNEIVPCSPNKILLSKITTLRPFKRMLPIGFDTYPKSKIEIIIRKLDEMIVNGKIENNEIDYKLCEYNKAEEIIKLIYETLNFEGAYEWDIKAYISSMKYFSMKSNNKQNKDKIWIIPRVNRNIRKFTGKGDYADAPDTPRSKNSELNVAKQIAKDIPALILLRENAPIDEGKKGWKHGHAFWWPVLVIPENSNTVVFSAESIE